MKIADNLDIHKISEKIELRTNRTIHFGVSCPCVPRQNLFNLCLEHRLFSFYWIFMRLADNLYRRKIWDLFEFRLDQTFDFGVTCPLVPKTPYLTLSRASLLSFNWNFMKLRDNLNRHKILDKFELCPHWRGGGHIVLVWILLASAWYFLVCTISHELVGGFAWMSHWDLMKSWLGFGDLDLIFKVTVGLELPNLSQKVLLYSIPHELVGRFQPDLHGYNIGTWWRAGLDLVTYTYFSRSLWDLNCLILAKSCLCAQYLMNQLADFN